MVLRLKVMLAVGSASYGTKPPIAMTAGGVDVMYA